MYAHVPTDEEEGASTYCNDILYASSYVAFVENTFFITKNSYGVARLFAQSEQQELPLKWNVIKEVI